MYGTALADESGPKLLEGLICAHKYPPEAVGVLRVVRSMFCVAVEGDWIRNLHWHFPDFHVDAERLQALGELPVKVGDRARRKRHCSFGATASLNKQLVMDEIELNLKDSA